MNVDTVKENLRVNKLVATKKEIVMVEGDMIVPDSKPDILNTICTSGVVCIYKKDVLDEKIRLDGNINTYIMYLADDSQDKVRGINTSLDFSESISISNCLTGMYSEVKTNLKSIEAKVINGRKISIKATIEFNIKIYSNEEVEIINDIQNAQGIQFLKENLKVNSLVGTGETKIYAKDTISIDAVDNLAEILKVDVRVCNKDIKTSYNKILTKAEAEVKIMYLTEDNRINTVNSKIPIVGFIDIADVTEENISDIEYEIKNIVIKPNSAEEHSIYVEIEFGVMAVVYENKEINLIQDLYSPCENLEFNKKQIATITEKTNNREIKQIREKLMLDDIANKTLLDVDVEPVITNQNNLNSRIIFEGELQLKFSWMDANSQVDIKIAKIPFEHVIENVRNGENMDASLSMEVMSQDFIVQDGGNITSNIDMAIDTNLYRNTNINILDEIQTNGEREEQDYNVVMYIVKKDDTLWKIAKKFGSTIDDIVRVNGIENPDQISIGQKIFIPRYARSNRNITEVAAVNYA